MKWLVNPRAGPPEHPKNKYKGHPITKMLKDKTIANDSGPNISFNFIYLSPFFVFLTTGTWLSFYVRWLFLLWWTEWLCYHEKYGTSSKVCRMYPKMSFKILMFENAPWPHSCPRIHTPVQTVPVNNP